MLSNIELNTPDEILAFIIIILICLGLLMYCVMSIICTIKTENLRNDYIKTLNEHDKSVIATFKATKYQFLKKGKKKNVSNS